MPQDCHLHLFSYSCWWTRLESIVFQLGKLPSYSAFKEREDGILGKPQAISVTEKERLAFKIKWKIEQAGWAAFQSSVSDTGPSLTIHRNPRQRNRMGVQIYGLDTSQGTSFDCWVCASGRIFWILLSTTGEIHWGLKKINQRWESSDLLNLSFITLKIRIASHLLDVPSLVFVCS